jgi:ketosteroid isomerase-like protein
VSVPEPGRFADEWIASWNRRDVDAVLTHYADDVVFTSPTALRFAPESAGTVRGKDALRSYWTRALGGNPDLRFELIGVYAGIDTIALHYRNQVGGLVNEVLTFRDGLVVTGHATHCTDEGLRTTAQVVTAIDAVVIPERSAELVDGFRTMSERARPDGLVRSELLRGHYGLWRIQTTWRDSEALTTVRNSGEPPAALRLLDALGAHHTHAVFSIEQSHD